MKPVAEEELGKKMQPVKWGWRERTLFTLLVGLAAANLALNLYVAIIL